MNKEILELGRALTVSVGKFMQTDEGKKALYGTYKDGTPRDLGDAIRKEKISPKKKKKKEDDKEMLKLIGINTIVAGLCTPLELEEKKKKKKKGKKSKKKKKDKLKKNRDFWYS